MTRFLDRHASGSGSSRSVGCCRSPPPPTTRRGTGGASARRGRDEALKGKLRHVHAEPCGVYGARKVWRQLHREGVPVASCTVERLMRDLGALRCRARESQAPHRLRRDTARPADLVERDFSAPVSTRLWVADLTYVRTWSGFAYVAFLSDACSRSIVCWQAARSLRTNLALDVLEQALWARSPRDRLVHHSDRGGPYRAIRYTERLAEAGAVPSVGSRGDSCDNALGGVGDRALQGGACAPPGTLARAQRPGARHAGVGRLVQPPPPLQRDRLRPARRVRDQLLPCTRPGGSRGPNEPRLHQTRGGSPRGASHSPGGLRHERGRRRGKAWRMLHGRW